MYAGDVSRDPRPALDPSLTISGRPRSGGAGRAARARALVGHADHAVRLARRRRSGHRAGGARRSRRGGAARRRGAGGAPPAQESARRPGRRAARPSAWRPRRRCSTAAPRPPLAEIERRALDRRGRAARARRRSPRGPRWPTRIWEPTSAPPRPGARSAISSAWRPRTSGRRTGPAAERAAGELLRRFEALLTGGERLAALAAVAAGSGVAEAASLAPAGGRRRAPPLPRPRGRACGRRGAPGSASRRCPPRSAATRPWGSRCAIRPSRAATRRCAPLGGEIVHRGRSARARGVRLGGARLEPAPRFRCAAAASSRSARRPCSRFEAGGGLVLLEGASGLDRGPAGAGRRRRRCRSSRCSRARRGWRSSSRGRVARPARAARRRPGRASTATSSARAAISCTATSSRSSAPARASRSNDRAERCSTEADRAERAGDPIAAALALRRHLEQHADDRPARLRLARLLIAAGERAAARQALAPLERTVAAGHAGALARRRARARQLDEAEGALAARGRALGAAPGRRHRRRPGARAPRPPPPAAPSPLRPGADARRHRHARLARRGRDPALPAGPRDRPRRDRHRLPGARRGARSAGGAQDPAPAAGRRRRCGALPRRRAAPGGAAPSRRRRRLRRRRARRARWPWSGSRAARCARASRRTPSGLPADEVAATARALLDALAFLHGRGIVHGDLKPSNLLLRAPGEVVLADFGGAARVDRAAGRDAPRGGRRDAALPGARAVPGRGRLRGDRSLRGGRRSSGRPPPGARSGATPICSARPAGERRGRGRDRADGRRARCARASPRRPRLFWLFLIRARRHVGLGRRRGRLSRY